MYALERPSMTMAVISGIDLCIDGTETHCAVQAPYTSFAVKVPLLVLLVLFPRHLHYPDGRVRAKNPGGSSVMYCSR
jgi:hypothetical protein